MAQRVAAHALGDARSVRRFADRALRHRVVEMMASYHAVLRIGGAVTGRKHVLPEPLAARAWILARERVWQAHLAISGLEIACVQRLHPRKMRGERRRELLRHHRHAILLALPV